MNDANLNVEGPPSTIPPRENRVFKGQAIPFVLLRICIFIALAMGISFALQWIAIAIRSIVRLTIPHRERAALLV